VRDAKRVVAADEQLAPVIGVLLRISAKGRDLDDLAALEEDVDQAEAPADDARVAEQLANLLGAGARRDIEVLGAPIEKQIAHTATHEVSLVPVTHEAPENLLDVGIESRVVEDDVITARRRDGLVDELDAEGIDLRAS
jgi:hypothetical protein